MDQAISPAIAARHRRRTITAIASGLALVCGAAWGIHRYASPSASAHDIAVAEVRRGDIANSQLMEQALLNVVKNAMEAVETTMREQAAGGGTIALSLQAEEGGVRLSITDSGRRLSGVPASQLFTPFFSTKKGGQGIGLLFVREVLNRHGYSHRLAADARGDTCFEIWLTAP